MPARHVRVLYLNPFAQEVSGPDESLLTLLTALVPAGVEPHVVVPALGPQVPRYEAVGATVHVAPLAVLRRELAVRAGLRYSGGLVRGVAHVTRLARRLDVALIHTNMEVLLEGGVAARVLGLPHVLHYRGNTLDQPRIVFDVLTATWTALSDRVLCISEATAAVFQRRGRGGKVQVLYNPVDVQRFVDAERSSDVRAALGAGPNDFLIGTVGRLHPRKDLATFLRTAAIVGAAEPRAKFVVVGAADGPAEIAYEATLRALVAELDLADRVTFAGARRDIPSVMKALDLFMLTSRHEGFGRVVAEAMAAARPIVVTREGALPELVHDPATGQACGLCAAAESPDQFATQALTLMRDQHAAGALADRAVRRARLFDRELVSSRVLALYRSLVDSSANGGVTSTTRPL